MAWVEELVAAGTAAVRLPGVLSRRSCTAVRDIGAATPGGSAGGPRSVDEPARQPVLLVHGYAGTESVWAPLRQRLASAGFTHVLSLSYNSFATGIPELAAEVAAQARAAVGATGADGLHLVGHSLGGLVARYAVARPGLWDVASTVVTVATPNSGAPYARLGPGPCARHMLPGSSLLAYLCGPVPAARTRWLAYYSELDRVVPSWSARLTDPRLRAQNLLVPACGHLTICRDPRLVTSVVDELARSEADRAGTPAHRAVRRGVLFQHDLVA